MKLRRTIKSKALTALLGIALGGVTSLPTATADMVPGYDSWDDVLSAADGTTVNWFMWGGSETINGWVDKHFGEVVKERYNITLNRVPIGDTVDAVNLVLTEAQAGVTEGGSVDMIWINGDNFKTLKEA